MKAYAAPLLLVALGAVVASSGARLPAYTDANWGDRFHGVDVSRQDSDQLSAKWYAAHADAETPRHRRIDLGMGLAALGIAVAILFAVRRVRYARDLASLRSPATRRAFYATAALAWLSFIPAEWLWLTYTKARGDYPWWADNIAIPAAGFLFFGLLGLPVTLLGVALALRGAALPVPLWSAPALGPPYLVCTGLLVAVIAGLLVIILAVSGEPFLVPSAVLTVYLLLSGRAAAAVRGRRLTSGCS